MIAMTHGLLTGHAIDEILNRQCETRERFGEIAIKMAALTEAQVERLLSVQSFRHCTIAVEGLVLSGSVPMDQATVYLAEFLREVPMVAPSA